MSNIAQVSDRALIRRVLAGDPRAADQFVTRFTRLVWWILLHQVRLDPETAEGVYQDVFIHLWEDGYWRLRLWSGDGDFAAYLSPVVRHRGLDRLRASANRPLEPLPDTDDRRPFEPADEQPGPAEIALLEEQHRLLRRAVARLDDRERELYELRFEKELSYREIAAAVGITENHTGVKINRLVKRLAATVAEWLHGEPESPGAVVRSPGAGPSIE